MNLSHFSVSSNLCYFAAGSRLCQPARCELAELLPGIISASPLCPVPWVLLARGSILTAFQKSTLVLNATRKGRLAQLRNLV